MGEYKWTAIRKGDQTAILNALTSGDESLELKGIIAAGFHGVTTPAIVEAIKRHKYNKGVDFGWCVSDMARAYLHRFGIEEYTGDESWVLKFIAHWPEVPQDEELEAIKDT